MTRTRPTCNSILNSWLFSLLFQISTISFFHVLYHISLSGLHKSFLSFPEGDALASPGFLLLAGPPHMCSESRGTELKRLKFSKPVVNWENGRGDVLRQHVHKKRKAEIV